MELLMYPKNNLLTILYKLKLFTMNKRTAKENMNKSMMIKKCYNILKPYFSTIAENENLFLSLYQKSLMIPCPYCIRNLNLFIIN